MRRTLVLLFVRLSRTAVVIVLVPFFLLVVTHVHFEAQEACGAARCCFQSIKPRQPAANVLFLNFGRRRFRGREEEDDLEEDYAKNTTTYNTTTTHLQKRGFVLASTNGINNNNNNNNERLKLFSVFLL